MRLLLFFALTVFTAQAMASKEARLANSKDPLPIVSIERKSNLSKLDTSRPIYIEVKKNPVTASQLRNDLTTRGLKVVDKPAPDGITIEVEGLYSARLPTLRAKPFQLDQLLASDTAVSDGMSRHASADTENRMRGGADLVANALVGAGSQIGLGQTGGIAMALAQIVGLDVAISKTLGTDPRGFCFINCANWNKYIQEMHVAIKILDGGTEKIAGIKVTTLDELLHPVHLWEVAFGLLVSDLTGSPPPNYNLKASDIKPAVDSGYGGS